MMVRGEAVAAGAGDEGEEWLRRLKMSVKVRVTCEPRSTAVICRGGISTVIHQIGEYNCTARTVVVPLVVNSVARSLPNL